jgi:anti-anti-sigma regulatory factor
MIGELLKLRKKCDEGHVDLKFCNLSSDLLSLLKKLKLDRMFDIFATREDAVKAIQKAR